MTFHVDSEVGKLRRVMLHRPDLELQRLTPSNCADLLFDDVLWVKRARQEHNTFADVLREAVTRQARGFRPDMRILICADNDAWTKKNPGVTAAPSVMRRGIGVFAVIGNGFANQNPVLVERHGNLLAGVKAV